MRKIIIILIIGSLVLGVIDKGLAEAKRTVSEILQKMPTAAPGTRILYIFELGRTKDPQALEPLIDILLNNKNIDKYLLVEERKAAAEALGILRDKRGIPVLKKVLKESDKELLLKAANSLLWLGEKEDSYKVLDGLAKDDGIAAFNYFYVEKGKGKRYLRDKKAKEILIKALKYNSDEVKASAAYLLASTRIINNEVKDVVNNILKNSKDERALDAAKAALRYIDMKRYKKIEEEEFWDEIKKASDIKNEK